MKFYNVVSTSITKWGDKRGIKVSFQKFPCGWACYQGDGSKTKIMGWGNTKQRAAGNLIARKDYASLLGVNGVAPVVLTEIGEKVL